MDDNKADKISTSALAKMLEVPSQQLFSTLKDYGWIRKLEQGWTLTSKGEFEGGEYIHSKKYGRYIIWPEELAGHPLLQALEDNRHISATMLGKPFGLSAREVNRILAESGWIKHGVQGWELTTFGEQHGGIQLENDNSGTFYVMWPQAVQDNVVISRQLQLTVAIYANKTTGTTVKSDQQVDDLFANQSEYQGLDGHIHSSKAHWQVCHWLYMAGIVHACHRRLPVESDDLYADFYLPAQQLYIEIWDDAAGSALSRRMSRKELYTQMAVAVIDIEPEDLQQLDDVLTRQLRKHGQRIY